MGFEHILDMQGYDHLLFIITLCALYSIKDWKKVLILVTAFTIGHSVTLALAALDKVKVNSDLIELLIPITIFLTALYNIWSAGSKREIKIGKVQANYFVALFFGLIHGMGFSNFFKALLGKAQAVVFPLFSFNIGIELGQIIIVVFFFLLYYLLSRLIPFEHKSWNLFFSGAGAGVSLILIIEKLIA